MCACVDDFFDALGMWRICSYLLSRVRKRGSFGKGVFSEKSFFSRDCLAEIRDARVSRESPDCGKQRRFRPFSRDSGEFRDFRDSRDFSSEKTPLVMTPFSGPDLGEKLSSNMIEAKHHK